VPGLLIYDQPSQVYFPKRAAGDDESAAAEVVWRDQDVEAVRKVFALLGSEVRAANHRLQIIVLDHAGEDVWGGLDGVVLTEEGAAAASCQRHGIGDDAPPVAAEGFRPLGQRVPPRSPASRRPVVELPRITSKRGGDTPPCLA
jgi:hypothetical protein